MGAIRKSRAGEAGFTLVELLVVLAIIGLLIVAAPAIVSAARPGAEVRAAAEVLANDLRAARADAVAANRETLAVFDLADGAYRLEPAGERRKLQGGLTLAFTAPRRQIAGKEVSLLFFPDGSSTGGTFRIALGSHAHSVVAHGLTGRIAIDE